MRPVRSILLKIVQFLAMDRTRTVAFLVAVLSYHPNVEHKNACTAQVHPDELLKRNLAETKRSTNTSKDLMVDALLTESEEESSKNCDPYSAETFENSLS